MEEQRQVCGSVKASQSGIIHTTWHLLGAGSGFYWEMHIRLLPGVPLLPFHFLCYQWICLLSTRVFPKPGWTGISQALASQIKKHRLCLQADLRRFCLVGDHVRSEVQSMSLSLLCYGLLAQVCDGVLYVPPKGIVSVWGKSRYFSQSESIRSTVLPRTTPAAFRDQTMLFLQ